MKRLMMTTLGLAVAVALWGSVRAEEAKEAKEEAKEPAGKTLFVSNKCNSCHTIEAAGVEKKAAEKSEAAAKTTATSSHKVPDLSSVGKEQTADWMAKFLKKEVATKAGKKHMKLWKGTDEDLTAITSWLAEQKADKKDEASAEKAEAKPVEEAAKAAPETKAPETESK
jgi:mono/diheme cytochrome c family protein